MKNASLSFILIMIILIPTISMAIAQKIDGLYVNSYGEKSDPALIFVHGGPGYDGQDFEWSTAPALAAKRFFVIVYDQRGQGRSDLAQDYKDYSYDQYSSDLKQIIEQLKLDKPAIIGHSHGGPIALKFDQYFPGLISKIILVSAPVNFYKSLDSIRINCTSRYTATGDKLNIKKINDNFKTLNGEPSLQDEIMAVRDIFFHALNKPCDLYMPSYPTSKAIALRKTIAKQHVKITQENLIYPMANFVNNEHYIHIDQTEWVKNHAHYIFGIYGSEDGLFTSSELTDIQSTLASNLNPNRFQIIDEASHALYIDQQEKFIEAIEKILK